MSQSALAALLGSKPAQKTASAPAATPAATAAASPAQQPTTAPVLAAAASAAPAAVSTSAPSSPASAPSSTAAPAAPVEPGPNAAAVATPQGAPPDTLASLLGDFKANVGKAPQVNPPQAAAVLAGAAAKEVAGHPEPPEVAEAKVSPVQKPADVLAAEQATKTRRTAAVVQVELDAALKKVAELEAHIAAAAQTGAVTVVGDSEKDATIAEAVELIQQLQGEAGVQLDDNRKAWARVAELEEQLAKAGNGAAIELGQIDFLLLAGELQGRLDVGQTITLTGQL
jgi:hypothetical protein